MQSVKPFLRIIYAITVNHAPKSIDILIYLFTYLHRRCLGQDFLPFLPSVMQQLLTAVSQDVTAPDVDVEDMDDRFLYTNTLVNIVLPHRIPYTNTLVYIVLPHRIPYTNTLLHNNVGGRFMLYDVTLVDWNVSRLSRLVLYNILLQWCSS